jgi:hypothetical protein
MGCRCRHGTARYLGPGLIAGQRSTVAYENFEYLYDEMTTGPSRLHQLERVGGAWRGEADPGSPT